MSQPPALLRLDEALARARAWAAGRRRVLLGIAGAPGAGKSTLAARLAGELGPGVAVVGVDGFHLAQRELVRLGREQRKGAIDTFDAGGLLSLVRRLREGQEDVVYAPCFEREREEALAGAVPISRAVPLVVIEGNYLLAWPAVHELLDECWYLEVPPAVRVARLVDRHVAHGRSPQAARAWALGTDARNAALIEGTRARADAILKGN